MNHKILIAQDEDTCKNLNEYFSNLLDYKVVGATTSAKETIDLIVNLQPNIVLLDLIMQDKDGFAVLDYIQNNLASNKPKVLVLSALTHDSFVNKALNCGADDFVAKPCDNENLQKHIHELLVPNDGVLTMAKPKRRGIDERITSIFLTVGIPAHIKGFQYLREAIKLSIKEPDIINSITKELYPAIANKFETSSTKVERAIRHAIEVAWNRGKIENINTIFGIKVYENNEKPTNSEFIALISDKLILDIAQ